MEQNILVLCKVVDNFGDIGTVYRLAKSISNLRPDLNLTLVVSDLGSFRAMAPGIDPSKKSQPFRYKTLSGRTVEWRILDWNLGDGFFSPGDFHFPIVLECFQCGRPDWLEAVLFSADFKKTVQIVNIDYLTAEDYADDFHLLKSGTRSANIRKINFMPGFTQKTGALILDESVGLRHPKTGVPPFAVSVFSYERDFSCVVGAISDFLERRRSEEKDFRLVARVADGKGRKSFVSAWERFGKHFEIELLPFLPQDEWDKVVFSADFNFVRGEDSLSRACLAGVPFVWHAYPQDKDYQLVKVNALLGRMEPFFDSGDYKNLRSVWNWYNGETAISETDARMSLSNLFGSKTVSDSFRAFSDFLIQNGNLASKLLEYLDSLDF